MVFRRHSRASVGRIFRVHGFRGIRTQLGLLLNDFSHLVFILDPVFGWIEGRRSTTPHEYFVEVQNLLLLEPVDILGLQDGLSLGRSFGLKLKPTVLDGGIAGIFINVGAPRSR